jgi:hypothetical protein
MLALNVSAAILNGYAQVDDSVHATIMTMDESNKETYAQFEVALKDNQVKVRPYYTKAIEVQKASNAFYEYVQTFKDDMVFYLMSRGIEYNDAIKLLIKGYLFSNINADSSLRAKILDVIDTYWR